MKAQISTLIIALFFILSNVGEVFPFSDPWEKGNFKGRIAYSADGNYNDEDDWAASAVALAIFAEYGVKDKLVHFDYNCILPKTTRAWEKEHKTSILGAAKRYGYPKSIFHDCQKNLDAAVNSIARAINESSPENPLYFILAGPMEVPYLGIEKADPEKRKYVYCISHNRWNDGYASADLVHHNKRDVIPTGVTWIQITDQNQFLSTGPFGRPSTPEEWEPWTWLRDSGNSDLHFLWERFRATTRADCSDAGMAYFLMTGDEQAEIIKLRSLLEHNEIPDPFTFRDQIRLEAENFMILEGFDVEYLNDRETSQRINLKLNASSGSISTPFNEPYLVRSGRYDVGIRYFEGRQGGDKFALWVNDYPAGRWQSTGSQAGWVTHTVSKVNISTGDKIRVTVEAVSASDLKLDYVQVRRKAFSIPVGASLDDPEAQPGQIIVAGSQPEYLKYNGGGPVFLCGPDNPEDFLFRGTLNPDGTRSGGMQEEMIARLAKSGVNAFHCQMFRMQRCNIKNEGDDTHAPFIDHDPAKGLNEAVLNQWDGWLDLFEQHGIIVHLEFYNDATDAELMGWQLDTEGELHPDEHRFFEGIVNKFKYHKNIMWGIEESCNKLPRSRTPHFKKLGELIATTDNFNHPIIQSFVIPEDPEGDFPGGGGTPDDYIDDPNIRVVTWLHVVPHGEDFEAQHQQYLHYYQRDSRHFIVMKNETFHHPRTGYQSRRYMWSCAMAGIHSLEAYHHADRTGDSTLLREDGLINRFMEQTDFHRLVPRDDLAEGSTQWVLARPGQSYIAYTYAYEGEMGVKGMTAGTYDLLWFDTASGDEVKETGIQVEWGDATWQKPEELGNEIALYIKRRE